MPLKHKKACLEGVHLASVLAKEHDRFPYLHIISKIKALTFTFGSENTFSLRISHSLLCELPAGELTTCGVLPIQSLEPQENTLFLGLDLSFGM
jgi:hypothetical protein